MAIARHRIENEKKSGERKVTTLQQIKKISAANIVRCGHYVIGKDIADEIMDWQIKREQVEHEKKIKREAQYMKRHAKAKEIIDSKGRPAWTKTDYHTILMAMKVKGDAKLPTNLQDLSKLYDNWKDRKVGIIVEDQESLVTEEGGEEMGCMMPVQNSLGGILF
jgi:hypothetical protein